MVFNGHGQIVFVQKHLCQDALAKYTKVIKAIQSSSTTSKQPLSAKQLEAHVVQRIELIDIFCESSSWLVAIYDLGASSSNYIVRFTLIPVIDTIESSRYSAQIKMNLAQNIPIYQVPDTDDESLELLLGLISKRP
jgi:hypothetical protein